MGKITSNISIENSVSKAGKKRAIDLNINFSEYISNLIESDLDKNTKEWEGNV